MGLVVTILTIFIGLPILILGNGRLDKEVQKEKERNTRQVNLRIRKRWNDMPEWKKENRELVENSGLLSIEYKKG